MVESLIKEDIVPPPKDHEELALEKLVFGDLEGFGQGLKNIEDLYNESSDVYSGSDEGESDEEDQIEDVQDDQLFFVDDGNEEDRMDVDESEHENASEEESEESDAWIDSEDEGISVSLLQSNKLIKLRKLEADDRVSGKHYVARLRSQFEKIYPRPKWVDQEEFSDSDEDPDAEMVDSDEANDQTESGDVRALAKILQSNKHLLNTKASKLLPHSKVDITRLKDANQKHPSKSAVQTISFHPTHPLLLTSGYDRTVRVYNIDGKNNNVVSTIHFRDSSIQTAEFNPNPNISKIYAGGRRRYMYTWDLHSGAVDKISRLYGHEATQRTFEHFKLSPKGNLIALQGNNGWINILSAQTAQWVHGFKIEGTIVDFDWGCDEDLIVGVNSVGQVWEFNMATQKVAKRWNDETGVSITRIKLGGKNDRWCAIGSASGVVNIYDRLQATKKPAGTVENLVNTISSLEFNHDGQILCIASRAKKDALRLVHVPSFKVFQNWPTSGTPLGRVTAVKFSPNSEMLCVGNLAGKARLWSLNHY